LVAGRAAGAEDGATVDIVAGGGGLTTERLSPPSIGLPICQA